MTRETTTTNCYDAVHKTEQLVLETEVDIGTTDVSICLPGWIKSFCEKFELRSGWELSHGQVNAICHTLIAARARQHRLLAVIESTKPKILRTERFTIHRHKVTRDENVGGFERTVFHAWYHSEDVAKPVCIVTVNERFWNYVEWIHVDEQYRRKGIATEVLRAIEMDLKGVMIDGATGEGEAFCDAYEESYPDPAY